LASSEARAACTAVRSARESTLILVGVELLESVLRRLGEGSSGVVGVAGEEDAAALCINFIVKSLEDIDFGVGAWLLADDILTGVKLKTRSDIVW